MALSLDDLKKLPPKQKALIFVGVYLLLGYFYYMLFLQDALAKGASLSEKMATLQQQVAEKEKAVAQIDRFVREINELKAAFQVALQKLPNEREIPGLLASVAQAGHRTGLTFLLFEPIPPPPPPPPAAKPATPLPAAAKGQPAKPAVPEKFYDEIRVRVQVVGGFHNTLSFFEQVARIPRIVNIEEISIGDAKEEKGRGRTVKTSCIVKTYMFVDRKS